MWCHSDLDDVAQSQDAGAAVRLLRVTPSAVRSTLVTPSAARGLQLLLLTLMLSGCMQRSVPVGQPAEAPQRTTLEVDNRGFADMTVYVIDGGQRVRLGVAPGNAKTELAMPAHLVTSSRSLRFLADPIGSSRQAVSQEIYVQPGDRVVLMIQGS